VSMYEFMLVLQCVRVEGRLTGLRTEP
jgi:hypothetical protein